jgi:NitT/TauT family transport system substrate-binding protein
MDLRSKSRLTRRRLLGNAALLGAAAALPRPALAALTPVNFSLSWLPEGGTNHVYASQPIWGKAGLDVPIARGFGSVSTAQAVAAGKIDIALCSFGSALLSAMKGLDLQLLGTRGYDSTMGIAVKAGGPIKSPKDLVGKKIGTVPTSAESPYLSAYLKLMGVDESQITKVAVDTKVIEQTLIRGQVDAITMIGTSSIPVFMSQGFPVSSFSYAAAGLPFYGGCVIARTDFVKKNAALCETFMVGINEGIKASLLDPEATIKLHMAAVPELAASSTGEDYARIGMAIFQVSMLSDEAMQHEIGYGDLGVIDKQIASIKTYVAGPDDKQPKASDIYMNQFNGHVTMTPAEWAQVKTNNAKVAALMGKA